MAAAPVVVIGLTTRKMADARLSEWTEDQAVPTVAISKLDTRGRRTVLEVPGRLEALSQAQLYARVSGYLKEWKADIGAPVKAGQVIAEIDAPDLDQQIMQSQANLAQRASRRGALRRDTATRANPDSDGLDHQAGSRSANRPTRPASKAWSSRRKPISIACASWSDTRVSLRRSTGW